MIRVLLALMALVGLMWFFARLSKMTPEQRARFVKLALLWGAAGILLALIVTGRLHPLFAALGALVPWLQRLIMARQAFSAFSNYYKAARGPVPGQSSDVETTYLRMSLDHDTGRMDGEVIAGTFSGRRIGELGLEELLALVAECERADPSSVSILESYLDREHGDAWREARRGGGEGRPSGGTAEMTVDEALEVLGLEAGASHDDIVAAHRRLMQKLHPDRGGSGFLAAQINRAKDLLLAQS